MGGRVNYSFVLLIFKCAFDLGFKLLTQSNENLIDKFVVGWIYVISEIKRLFFQW